MGVNKPQRDMVFLSHANPEDNDFTLWLALQLAKEGYPVWCDLTKLLGGEVFWDEAEEAIRTRTAKFLYVLSKDSNEKDGPLRELHLAQGVARHAGLPDFVIPLHIDDLRSADVTIELARVNYVPFERSWARGLARLLETFETQHVPKKAAFTRGAVSSWWRRNFAADMEIIDQPDEHVSNWFPIQDLPKTVYYHSLTRAGIGKVEVPAELPWPAVQDGGASLFSFAKAEDFQDRLGELSIAGSKAWDFHALLQGERSREFRRCLSQILRLAWEGFLEKQDLPVYELGNKAKCLYFTKGMVADDDRIHFEGVTGKKTYRNVVGYATAGQGKRYWHFGVSAKPLQRPELVYMFKAHVLFSDDGNSIWDDKDRVARARRSQCKNWWNDEWRDRILATMTWLADARNALLIPLGSEVDLRVSARPLVFEAPVSYVVSESSTFVDDLSDYDFEEDDEEREESYEDPGE